MAAQIRAWLAREDGMTLPELLTAMSILAFVVTGILVLFVGGLNATTRMNSRFQAQQNARLALSSLRYEVGFACSATWVSTDKTRVSLILPDANTQSCTGSTNQVTWCADSANTQPPYGLYRQTGGSCSASTGVKRASSLQSSAVFPAYTCTGTTRAQLGVSMLVNANFATSSIPYTLTDTITLRNATIGVC
ncbi:MAG TPA: prepilin-type N-terminal cleavage/methylation domain-containing protein [Gaiellaceae bacterium]|nr:prepilin-type N-terminal cleavage/methylation domain-containing protein [Gaiellaceae bacterium]